MRGKALTRRHFLLGTLGMSAASGIAWAAPGRPDASGRFATGHIGLGQRGAHLLAQQGIDPRAFFDVDVAQITRAAPSARAGARTVERLDALLAMSDLDAVLIATPDHWHTRIALAAVEAGKDIFIESPCIWQPYETQALLSTVRRWGAVAQSGEMLPYTQAGAALKQRLSALVPDSKVQVSCRAPLNPSGGGLQWQSPPEGFDWKQWLGHLEDAPYNPDYAHVNWRNMLHWGGGLVRSVGTAQLSTLLWSLGLETPQRVTVRSEGAAPASGLWDCPPSISVAFEIDSRISVSWQQAELSTEETPCVMRVEAAGTVLHLQGMDEQATLRDDKATLAGAGWDGKSPVAAWCACMAERTPPRLPLATACAASTLTQLAVLAYRLRQPLEYDFASGRVTNNDAANRLLRPRPGALADALG